MLLQGVSFRNDPSGGEWKGMDAYRAPAMRRHLHHVHFTRKLSQASNCVRAYFTGKKLVLSEVRRLIQQDDKR